jgi:hypothetical protein
MAVPLHNLPAKALGHEQLTVSSTAVALPNIPERAQRTVIRTLGQSINWTDHEGGTPTDSTGMALLADEVLVYDGDPYHIRLILDSSATGDADVRVAYYE